MPDSKAPARKLAKVLRREIRSKLISVSERAQFLALIDASFQKELDTLGLDKIITKVLGNTGQPNQANTKRVRETLKGVRKKGQGDAAPLKSFRRQLRSDFAALLNEAQLLTKLDPAAETEVNDLGLNAVRDKLR